jgi:hypothetical protein
MIRLTVAALAVATLAACAVPAPPGTEVKSQMAPTLTPASASVCDQVSGFEGWYNRMPGPAEPGATTNGAKLIAVATVAGGGRLALRQAAQEGPKLVIEVVEDASASAGQARFEGQFDSTVVTSLELRCGGRVIGSIATIDSVY